MDAFDQMRSLNVGSIDASNIESNQQSQQHQIQHHHQQYQTTNYHATDNLVQHHDQQQHSGHIHSPTGHLESLQDSHQHLNQLTASHINNDSNNIHNIVECNDGGGSNYISIPPPALTHIEKVNNYQHEQITSSQVNLYDNETITHGGLRQTNTNLYDTVTLQQQPTHVGAEKILTNSKEDLGQEMRDDSFRNKLQEVADNKQEVTNSVKDEFYTKCDEVQQTDEMNTKIVKNDECGKSIINTDTNQEIKIEIQKPGVREESNSKLSPKVDKSEHAIANDKTEDDTEFDKENESETKENEENDSKDESDDEETERKDNIDSNDEEVAIAPLFPDSDMGDQPKVNGVTEVILMDEPADCIDEDGIEEHQEDVLAGELADSEVANTLNVKPISNFIIKVKEIIKDDNTHTGRRSSRRSPAMNSDSPGSKRARSNTPIELSNSKSNDDEASTMKKGEEIDENQCRICLSKDDLVSIFKSEGRQTIADKILLICTTVRIQRRDFLPQYICNTCMQSVQVAFNLKRLCEATDKDLRSKLSRSKKNMRRPTEYVLLDATKFGDSDESVDDEPSDDDEFKISNEEEIKSSEPDSDSVSSDFGSSKRRSRRIRPKRPQARRSRPVSKSLAKSPITTISSSSRPAPASVKRSRRSDTPERSLPGDFSTGSEDDFSPPKKRQSRSGSRRIDNSKGNASKEGHCVYCNELFPSQNALQKHKKSHAGEKPLICEMCGKTFKMLPSYQAHLTKHKEDGDTLMCTKCDKTFQKLADRRKHLIEDHNERPETFPCDKCKRIFSLKKSLERHAEDGKCIGSRKSSSFPQRRVKSEMENLTLGRDLFKCVAPVTTTYWSDSFSD